MYLSNQLRVNKDQIEPCCWIGNSKKLNIVNATDADFKEYKSQLEQINDWIPECNFCREKELKGIDSPRQLADTNMTGVGIYNEEEIGNITSLELQIDSNCNAACLMCGEYNSTTWQKYNIGGIDNKTNSNKEIDLLANNKTQERLKSIIKFVDLSKINLIVFLGGEPLGVDLHKQLLRLVQQNKPLNQVALRYITNGSVRPDLETIDLWKQSKSVKIVFSIDGIGEHFNYLRWPLQWNQVESNIRYFIDLNIPSVTFGISSVISPFNIFYYDRYLEWEANIFKDSNMTQGFSKAFESTGAVNTSSIPPGLINEISKKYLNHPWLVKRMRQFDSGCYDTFIKYVTTHDQKRNLDWKKVFPEIVQYFDDLSKN